MSTWLIVASGIGAALLFAGVGVWKLRREIQEKFDSERHHDRYQ